MKTRKLILSVVGVFSLIIALSSFRPAPPEEKHCVGPLQWPNLHKLIIPGVCYYYLTLEGDVYKCNTSEEGLCYWKLCYTETPGCRYVPFQEPIE